MADIITGDHAAPDGQGSNDAGSRGAVTGQAEGAGKSFTQEQVDSIVKSRLAEERKRLEAKFDERLAAELEKAKSEFEKRLDTEVANRLKEREAELKLEAARAAIQEEFGLTESQAKRLNGKTPEELRADAEELFGTFVQQKDPRADMLKEVAEKTGLSERQIARLQGDTVEEMIADAVETFGVQLQEDPAAGDGKQQPKPPVLLAGGGAGTGAGILDASKMSPAEIRANWQKLWPSGN